MWRVESLATDFAAPLGAAPGEGILKVNSDKRANLSQQVGEHAGAASVKQELIRKAQDGRGDDCSAERLHGVAF